MLLHYWREYSHREIAALLGIAVTTVNNHLHAARTRLREEITIMAENVNRAAAASPLENLATGTIVATYGPIADVKFTHNRLPPLRGWLVLSGKPDARKSPLVVVQYLRDGVARAVAVSNGTSLKSGPEVIGAEHVETATRTRDLLRRFPPEPEGPSVQEGHSAEDQTINARARRLRRFLTQPLYVAAPGSVGQRRSFRPPILSEAAAESSTAPTTACPRRRSTWLIRWRKSSNGQTPDRIDLLPSFL